MGMVIDTSDFKKFSVALREQSPLLAKRLRSNIGKVGRASATKIRAEVPHQQSTGNWGTLRGVRFSDAVSSKGGAILIEHLAYTFGVGQPGRMGHYKHKVYGKWSSSEKTIEPISPFVIKGWLEVGTAAELAADAAIDETVQALSFGGGSVESDLA